MIQRLLPVALLLVATACEPAPVPAPTLVHPEGIEFRIVIDADDPGATEFLHEGSTLHLGPPGEFAVARVWSSFDEYGAPAIGFEVANVDADRFSEWTGSIVGSKMAVVVRGQVISAPTVSVPLRRGGRITGGSAGFTDDEVRDMIKSMEPQREVDDR